jgi:flavin-dependent dehydrogenase
MGKQGFSVLVIDKSKDEDLGKRLDVIHVDKDYFAKFEVPEPKEGDEDYVGIFEYQTIKSAFNNHPKKVEYPFLVLRFAPLMQRLKNFALSGGAEFSFETSFKELIYDGEGKIVGLKVEQNGEETSISCRLVVDASGIPSVVRRTLKDTSPVENFEIDSKDQFYVTVRYVQIKNPERDRVLTTTGWAYYKAWLAPALTPDTAVIGIGSNNSHEYGEKWFKAFKEAIPLPEHTEIRIQRGATPWRRPPYSLVDNGFLAIGDSACITKPYSGEGIACTWNLCDIASWVVGDAMKDGGYPTLSDLWDINLAYFSTQGADFAYILPTLISAVNCSAKENDYEFEKEIVFRASEIENMNRVFAVNMSVKDSLSLACKVAVGALTGKIRLSTVVSLLKGVSNATKLKKLYQKYPVSPEKLAKWSAKAEKVWVRVGKVPEVI